MYNKTIIGVGFFDIQNNHGLGKGYQPSLRLRLINPTSTLLRNSNWTEWSTIQGVIPRVISKSDEHEARGRFEIMSTITP